MQVGSVALGQSHGFRGRAVAGFGRADQRMHRRRDVIAVFCTEKFHVVPYRGFVFTVRGNQYGRFGKDRGQCLFIIDQHVPCGGAHEKFDSADPFRIDSADLVEVVVRGTQIERVVCGRGLGSPFETLFQQCAADRWRFDVRHIHKRGDPSGNGCCRFASYVGFVGQTRFAEVNLIVDHTGQHKQTGGIDHRSIERAGRVVSGTDLRYAFVFDENIPFVTFVFVDDRSVTDQ